MGAKSLEEVADFIKSLRFRKTLLGGVSEENVWKKLEELNNEYKSVFDAQEVRYQALLQERDKEIERLKEKLSPKREG